MNAFVIDHDCTDLSRVPVQWINQAKSDLLIGYSHTSHGSQLETGISAFRGEEGSTYYYTYSSWAAWPGFFLNDMWANEHADDLGYEGDLAWLDATVVMLDAPDNDRNVVMWSWCGGVSDNTPAGIDAYLDAMNRLERDYPHVTFIYMTGHLDGSGENGTLHQMNERIRSYCNTNNKILFDFADIESYDPDGNTNYMPLNADDNCDYDSDGDGSLESNWANNWIDANPDSELARISSNCGDCAHSQRLNCVLKGRAFWWMMARIAGWDPGGVAPPPPSPFSLYYPHVASEAGHWETLICALNKSGEHSVSGVFKAYDDAGEAVSQNIVVTLPPRGRREIKVGDEFTNPGDIGYVVFESDSDEVCGFTKFYVSGQCRAAVPAVSEINTGDVHISHIASNQTWLTGISLVNTAATQKMLTIRFDDGTTRHITLEGYAHKAFSIRGLFDNVARPEIHSGIIEGMSGVVGLELFGTATQLSGVLLKDETASDLYFPHIVDNDLWRSGIVAYNPFDTSRNLTITPYTADGTALAVQNRSIPEFSRFIGSPSSLGLAHGTAWFHIRADGEITGFELFSSADANRLGGYTAVNINSAEGIFPNIDKNGETDIAIVNVADARATVLLTCRDDNGGQVAC